MSKRTNTKRIESEQMEQIEAPDTDTSIDTTANGPQPSQSQSQNEGNELSARPKDSKGRFTDANNRESRLDLGERFKTKSAVIRYLTSENYSPSSIAKFLDVRYQHVRNVLNQQPKKVSSTTTTTTTTV